jgi:hypothetical protein
LARTTAAMVRAHPVRDAPPVPRMRSPRLTVFRRSRTNGRHSPEFRDHHRCRDSWASAHKVVWQGGAMGEWNGVELDELVLSSERLTLRPWRAADAADVEAVMAEPAMHRFLPLHDPYTRAEADEFVGELGVRGRRAATSLPCARGGNRTAGRRRGTEPAWATPGGRLSSRRRARAPDAGGQRRCRRARRGLERGGKEMGVRRGHARSGGVRRQGRAGSAALAGRPGCRSGNDRSG